MAYISMRQERAVLLPVFVGRQCQRWHIASDWQVVAADAGSDWDGCIVTQWCHGNVDSTGLITAVSTH